MRFTIMTKLMITVSITIILIEAIAGVISVVGRYNSEIKNHSSKVENVLDSYSTMFSEFGPPNMKLLDDLSDGNTLFDNIGIFMDENMSIVVTNHNWEMELSKDYNVSENQMHWISKDKNGVECLYSQKLFTYAGQNYRMILVYDLMPIYDASEAFAIRITLITLLIISIVLISIFVSAHFTINQPLKKLLEKIRAIAEGAVDQSNRLHIDSKDEMGDLARYVNQSLDRVFHMLNEEHILNETGQEIANIMDLNTTFETVLQTVIKRSDIEYGSVFLLNDSKELEIAAFSPLLEQKIDKPARTFKLGEGILGLTALEQKISYIADTSKNENFSVISQENGQALLCIPLIFEDQTYGVMNFSCNADTNIFEHMSEKFIQTISQLTVLKVKNIQMFMEIQEYQQSLENKVKERTASIRHLLNNAGEGFLSFGDDYKIHDEYSRQCVTFFGDGVENQNVLDLVFDTNARKTEDPKELFDLIFNGDTKIAVVEGMLPSEIKVGGKDIAVVYRRIKEENDDRVMLILSDITDKKQLTSLMAADEERNNMIIKVALDRDGFYQFLRELDALYQLILSELEQAPGSISLDSLFRHYHTIKGGLASYSIKKAEKEVHNIESILDNCRKTDKKLTKEAIIEIKEKTEKSKIPYYQALDKIAEYIPIEDRRGDNRIYKVSKEKIENLQKFISESLPEMFRHKIEAPIQNLYNQPIAPILRKLANVAENIASQLGKKIKVEVKGESNEVNYESLEGVFSVLGHLVRNLVDHGLEDNADRLKVQKPEEGVLTINASISKGILKLILSDDGQGIDSEKIKEIALLKKLIDEDFISKCSKDDLINLIFKPGFSTKEALSTISGRGVGMDAVLDKVESVNGTIKVNTILGKGTTFELKIPNVV